MSQDKTAIRPAATVIVLRDRAHAPQVLMGQRGAQAAFMPNKFVFPGGAVDPQDATVALLSEISNPCKDRLSEASEGPSAQALCAHPTSRYQSLQTSRSAPSAITWYCAIAANVETAECKRNAVSAKLRGLSQQPGSSLEARKKLLEELKAHPFDYAKMQAIQADFCKVWRLQ